MLLDAQIHQWEKGNGQLFNVGGGLHCGASLQELTKISEELTGNNINIARVEENRAADIRIYYTDNTKVTETYGWSPTKNMKDVCTDIFEWMKKIKNYLNLF